MAEALAAAGLRVRVPTVDTSRCSEKLGWPTVEGAVAQAHQLCAKRAQRQAGVYLCPACGAYHLSRRVDCPDTVACSTNRLAG